MGIWFTCLLLAESTEHGREPRSLTSATKCVFFILMQATLTELRRETSRILGPVIHASQKVLITENGRKIAAIVPISEPDRKRALQMLTAIGPVEMPNRQ
jgi:prevent-host-death family protein